ncbi:hypothetical protein SEPCBS119000_002018 [Sporothrix epigloea]|uniref:Uncharacterized protein n=1 Tax=Sporothrix epigloea TaxID=1892477 RepID=A0ABP0DH51_9PEZI
MGFTLTPKRRLMATIAISFSFFVAEITVAFMTRSLALLADAFHYMNDLIGFIVALVAVVSIERFISLQKVENPKLVLIMGCVGFCLNVLTASFLHEHHHGDSAGHDEHNHAPNEESGHGHGHVDDDQALHAAHAEHRHLTVRAKDGGRDLNMLGALVHVLGDAANNVGVIIAAVVIWKTHYPGRFYADPGVSMAIAFMILLSSIPLVKNSGTILMESAPRGVDIQDVKHDLEKIEGIESVHELHIWRLDQQKAIASAHVVVSDQSVSSFMEKARTVSECLHAYGIHSATLQPELSVFSQLDGSLNGAPGVSDGKLTVVSSHQHQHLVSSGASADPSGSCEGGVQMDTLTNVGTVAAGSGNRRVSNAASVIRRRRAEAGGCQIPCGKLCENLTCCK